MTKNKIIQDTREQKGLFITKKPLSFDKFKKCSFDTKKHKDWITYINKETGTKGACFGTLKTGDYSFIDEDGKDYRDEFAIEYKNPSDAYGSFGRDHKRFKKEFERAKKLKYFAIVISATYTDLLNKTFPYGYKIRKMKGYILMKIINSVHMKYGFPIYFCNGRMEAKNVIRGLMNAYKKNRKET